MQVTTLNGPIACEGDDRQPRGGVAAATFRHPFCHLATWLADLRQRGVTITLEHGEPSMEQPTPHDARMLARHTHALRLAAAGTHPVWWAWVSGRSEATPSVDDLPLVAPHDATYNLAHACACCGNAATVFDEHGLAWCVTHMEMP